MFVERCYIKAWAGCYFIPGRHCSGPPCRRTIVRGTVVKRPKPISKRRNSDNETSIPVLYVDRTSFFLIWSWGVSQRFPGQSSCGTGGGTLSSGDGIAAHPCFNVAPFYKYSSFFIEKVLKNCNSNDFWRSKRSSFHKSSPPTHS